MEAQLQHLGCVYSQTLTSEFKASQVASKMAWLRLLGRLIVGFAGFNFLTSLFPLLQAPANFPTLLVSFLACLSGYFLMESCARSLRVLALLHHNKTLLEKFEALASQSPAVLAYKQEVRMTGRAFRLYDVAKANVLRLDELKAINASTDGTIRMAS